ncbi:1,4-alpha-glucan branching protein domain-containing protein [Treponema brennaborense]|uniref:Glycoside hydrolase family 57 n=1 Tax=Treponema brennaborense (strain DSM 12168 / CIP 105900 / DD5/3) TaxID=906968 RepID=F4LPL7_TREBD|nr:1,4-alpha-glucan branching protein domain-containing protein [Treponema brennaborense]AEE17013.1 Domain of unknown function DUF1957 [Treponema brennaborense DSM 12168]
MPKKSFVITLVAHQGYIRRTDGDSFGRPENELLFLAISETYIPLLNMFESLDTDAVPFKLSMVITPTLCSLLSDTAVINRYVDWLDRSIVLGEKELTRNASDTGRKKQAQRCLDRVRKTRQDFIEVYKRDLLSAFRYYADRGNVELLATAATYAFLPHYADLPEAVNAQIETGVQAHRHFFGVVPEGFWLPYMGFSSGLEQVLRGYGFDYTVLNSHGVLFADPLPEKGIFAPVRCGNSFALFARDDASEDELTGPGGFMYNPVYRDPNRDVAFEASVGDLDGFLEADGTRISSGYAYWNRNESAGGCWYDCEAAAKQAASDAKSFFAGKIGKLAAAEKLLPGHDVSLVCAFDAKILGQSWAEGVSWLEQVFRIAASQSDVRIGSYADLLTNRFDLQKLKPFMSAATGTGYGENMLDSSNGWILQYSRKACERMMYLADRFPDDTGLKARALNLAAKEVLLAQSGDWPSMLHDRLFSEYAQEQVKKNVLAFTTVYDSLGANTISTEWLTSMEQEHPLFPWMNYRVFSKKK